jgi:hypothetical protein
MDKIIGSAAALSAALVLAACTTVDAPASAPRPPSAAPSAGSTSAHSGSPAPTVTVTVPANAPASAPVTSNVPNVTDPWAVVSAYYGDIESQNYRQAWALLSSGAVTGQSYQQFVGGFACTGSQDLAEISESGDQVTFDLTATDACTGAVQHFTGTDTVQDGKIVAASVQQGG